MTSRHFFRPLLCAALATLALLPAAAQAAPAKLVTTEWPGYTNTDGTGLYLEVVELALGKGSYEVTHRPWARAQAEMEAGTFDGIVGEDETRAYAYPAWPIDVNMMAVVFKKAKMATWPGKQALANHSLAWVRGYEVSKFAANEGVTIKNFQEVDSLDAGLRMLSSDRFDVMIDFDSDIQDAFTRLNLNPADYVIAPLDLNTGAIKVGFRNDDAGRALAKRFDEGMAAAAAAGKLEPLYKKYDRMGSLPYIKAK